MFGADRPYLFLTLVACMMASVVWAFLPVKASKYQTFGHAPVSAFINGYCRHDIYRGVPLAAIMAHWGETAVDFVHGETDAADPCIVVVLVHNWFVPVEFRRRFQMDDDRQVEMPWRPKKGRYYGEAWGLFVFSQNVHSATTQVGKPA